MMINSKYHSMPRIALRLFLLCFIFSSCTSLKKIKILGFVYRGEQVIIKKDGEIVMSFIPQGVEDENKICSFNEELALSFKKQDLLLSITINSNKGKLLDTIINVSKSSKEPFVSIQYPSIKNSFRRTLFVADANDSSYIIY